MSLSAAAIRMMAEKGLSASDIADVAEANEPVRTTNAARQKRYRERKARNERDVTRDVTPPPNDIYSNPPVVKTVSANADTAFVGESVVSAWNLMASQNDLAQARTLTASRAKHLRARIREHGEPAIFEAIAKVGRSDWHCGRSTGTWRADLGWLLKSPDNFQKILERNETRNGQRNGTSNASGPGRTERAALSFIGLPEHADGGPEAETLRRIGPSRGANGIISGDPH